MKSKITGYIWLENIISKLQTKHGVRVREVRETLEGDPRFRLAEKGHRAGEDVYAALGKTEAGRRLIVFFVRKRDGRALIVSARDMTDSERKRYGRR